MEIPSILDNKLAVGIICGILGAIASRLLDQLKSRIQELQYTVRHDRVGISIDDAIFGTVKAVWQGNELSNLYNSTVTFSNDTTKDLKDVVIKIYTGNTKLLSQHVSVKGSTYIPIFTEAYKQLVQPLPGEQANEEQLRNYFTNREYKIGTFNRGQTAIFQYLTHEPNNGQPQVWVEIQQEGLRAVYKAIVPEMHGVPLRRAIGTGVLVGMTILAGVVYVELPIWLSSTITLLVGWCASSIGAWLYKLAKSFIRFLSS
jgi:hypothetical protein